jgi:predicted nucleic acid-binding protein
LYPLSCIKGLNREVKMKLVNSGIVLMKQLIEEKPAKIARETGVSRENIQRILEKAKKSTYLLKVN